MSEKENKSVNSADTNIDTTATPETTPEPVETQTPEVLEENEPTIVVEEAEEEIIDTPLSRASFKPSPAEFVEGEIVEDVTFSAADMPGAEQSDPNEIDAFAKALLFEKNRMAIQPEPEEEERDANAGLSEEQIRQAESTLASALDQLRKERGQVPIDQEEEDFLWDNLEGKGNIQFEDRFSDMGDDFTTASLFSKPEQKEYMEEPDDLSAATYEEKKQAKQSHIELQEKRPSSQPTHHKKRKLRKKRLWIIAGVIVVILLLFGGYVYKVKVYDPSRIVTQEQENIYLQLQKQADEYSMNSDAEKMELLDLEADYNKLSSKQQSDLNKYFQEQTGKSYTQIVAELKAQNAVSDQNGEQGDATDASDDQQAAEDGTDVQYDETEDEPVDENAQYIADLNATISQLVTDRDNYISMLELDGSADGDEIVAEYNSQIAYYQSLLDQVQ